MKANLAHDMHEANDHLIPDLDSVAVGDFNDDGIPDLAVADANTGVSVLLGNGDGTCLLGSTSGAHRITVEMQRAFL